MSSCFNGKEFCAGPAAAAAAACCCGGQRRWHGCRVCTTLGAAMQLSLLLVLNRARRLAHSMVLA
jgi:hypothetical protein